jgi:Ca-activated chloride channel family protein
MNAPFAVTARCEHKNTEAGASTLWASIKIDPAGKALEAERAPLAVVLVVDVSGSMKGEPIAHVLKGCEIVADLLDERDRLAIVTFQTHAGVRCGLTGVDDPGRAQIRSSLVGIAADGKTNLHGGLEVAAGVLMTAPAGLRRVMVVMSDGQPNVGLVSPSDLGSYVKGLGLAVSSLGFGLNHDEDVLAAIADAGSGRYAYIPDPVIARVDLARAALAHGGIVADHLELKLRPREGVELLQLLPASPLRVGGGGVTSPIGDVFVDEGRLLAIELQLDLKPGATGRLADVEVAGRAPDGTHHRAAATLDIDVRAGARLVDRDAQRDVLSVQADVARTQARGQADRGAQPAAAAILRQMAARIDAAEGFVRNDGSLLAELREQLEDEAANHERNATDLERAHLRKAALSYKLASPGYARGLHQLAPVRAYLVGIGGTVTGQRFELYLETSIGRGSRNDIVIESQMLSRSHTRFLFVDDHYVLQDLGSTNGSRVNGREVQSARLGHGDVIRIGDAEFRFELAAPALV